MNNLEVLFSCPICNKKYNKGDIRLIQEKRETVLLHTRCRFCKNSSLALYSKQEKRNEAVAMGMLTDLDYEEACQVLSRKPITIDEVLDFYQSNR